MASEVVQSDEYVAIAWRASNNYLASLDDQVGAAWKRERILWQLFILVFILTLAAGSVGVVLVFLASFKVAIASGAAGVIPGCTSALLKRARAAQIKSIDAIEKKRDEQLRLRQSAAVISDLPPGPEKKQLQVDYARKMLSRIPK